MESANNTYLEQLHLQRSLRNILESGGPRIHPYGTPQKSFKGDAKVSKTCTEES
jgi:hypothetical protein